MCLLVASKLCVSMGVAEAYVSEEHDETGVKHNARIQTAWGTKDAHLRSLCGRES